MVSIPKPEGRCGVDRGRSPSMVSIYVKYMSKTFTFSFYDTHTHAHTHTHRSADQRGGKYMMSQHGRLEYGNTPSTATASHSAPIVAGPSAPSPPPLFFDDMGVRWLLAGENMKIFEYPGEGKVW
jgi:hypothetical protein